MMSSIKISSAKRRSVKEKLIKRRTIWNLSKKR